jgi:HEAT repeat protein
MGLFGPPNINKLKAGGNVTALIAALGYKKDAKVRTAAANALGDMAEKHRLILQAHVKEALVIALQDGDVEVRRSAANALRKTSLSPSGIEALMAALKDADMLVRRNSIDALSEMDENLRVVWHARLNESLVAALQDGHVEVRRSAANALRKTGASAEGIDALLAAAKDGDLTVQQYSIEALGKYIPRSGPELHIRLVNSLIDSLKDKKSYCRETAARALGIPGEARAIEPLIDAINDPEVRVGWAALAALKGIGASAIQPLIAVLWKYDAKTRNGAANTLRDIGWVPGPDENGAMYWVILRRWDKCIEIGAAALSPLIAALDDKNWGVRKQAAEALIAIYKSGQLSDAQHQQILELGSRIASDHADQNTWIPTGSSSDCTGTAIHTDNNGIGVSFQI